MDGMNVCEAAIEVIEKHGWIQHDVRNAAGSVCLIGALSTAASDMTNMTVPYLFAIRAVRDELNERVVMMPGMAIWDWNDTPDRTVEEVIEVLRYAAKREAGQR